MKSKNVSKPKSKGMILILIIIIILIGVFVLKNQKEDSKNISDSESINDSMNNSVVADNIDNSENNSNENNIITEVNVVNNINTLTNPKIEEIAKNTFNEYLSKIANYEKSNIGPMPYLLCELNLATQDELDKLKSSDEYIKSNVKYDDFKNALLQYVTEDYFTKFFSQYKNIDGYVAFCDCAGGFVPVSVEKAELISRVGNKFNFKLTIKDLEMYEHYLNDEDINEDECYYDKEVALEYINNRLVVSEYSSEIILEGLYYMENSDVSYEFYEDGKVEYIMNMAMYEGTYVTSGEKNLRITWEKEIICDPITLEETTAEMSGNEEVIVINDKKIRIKSEYNGETLINEFIKD